MAPPMRTTRSSASVLPPAPTVTSSRVCINRENMLYVFIIMLITCVCINYELVLREKSDDEMKEKGKGRRGVGDEDEDDEDDFEGEDDEDEDELGENESDEDMDEGNDAPVMRIGPPKRRSGPSGSGHVKPTVDGNIYFHHHYFILIFSILDKDIANLQLPTIQALTVEGNIYIFSTVTLFLSFQF